MFFGVAAHTGNEVLSLGSGCSVRLMSDDAVDSLSVHHNVDGEDTIAVGKSLKCDPVLSDCLAGTKGPLRGPCEFSKFRCHIGLPISGVPSRGIHGGGVCRLTLRL